MKRVLGFILLAALVVPAGLRAQDHSEQIAFLDMLVGTFEYEHIEGGGECEKVGLYNVNCVSRWTTTAGVKKEAIWITRFNPETESFIGYRFYENGYADSGHGWVDGNVSTFVYELADGTRMKIIQTWTDEDTTYTWHRSAQGGPWEQTATGSTKRVG